MWNYEFANTYLTHLLQYSLSLVVNLSFAVLEIHAQQVQLVALASHGCLSTLCWMPRIHLIVVWVAAILITRRNHSYQWMMIRFMLRKEQNLPVLTVILSRHIRTFSWSCRQLHRVLINSWHWVTSMHILANIFLSIVHQTKAGRFGILAFYHQFSIGYFS